MDTVVKEATGTFGQGRLQLLENGVRIVRGRNIGTIPFDDIRHVLFKPSTALHSGFISFVAPGVSLNEVAYSPERDRTVHFNGRQQKHFDEIRRAVLARIDGDDGPPAVAVNEIVQSELGGSPGAGPGEAVAPRGDVGSEASSVPVSGVVSPEVGSDDPSDSDISMESGPDIVESDAREAEDIEAESRVSEPAGSNGRTEAPPPDVEEPLQPDDGMIPRLVSLGRHLESSLAERREPAISVDVALDAARGEMQRIRTWLVSVEGTFSARPSDCPPGAGYLVRSARQLFGSAESALAETNRAASPTRGLFSRTTDPWLLLVESLRFETSATALLTVAEAYMNESSRDLDWVRHAPMYEVLDAGLAGTSKQLESVASDPASSTPSTVEPFFANTTANLRTLKAVIDDRLSDMSDARTPEQAEGGRYLLTCASEWWQRALDSLQEGRQFYLQARETWAGSVRLVLENIDTILLHELTGQSLVTMSDAYIRAKLADIESSVPIFPASSL